MRINLLVADEFRPEATGKQMAMGLFADGTVVLEPVANVAPQAAGLPRGIERLSFLMSVGDLPPGNHVYHAQIVNPSGSPLGPEMPLGEEVAVQGKSRVIVLETKPFIVNGTGTYNVNLKIDGAVHKLPFRIVERLPDGQLPA